ERAQAVDEMPHLIERSYDGRGIPTAYRLNAKIVDVVEQDDEITLSIKGSPITPEEIKACNMDKLIRKLLSFGDGEKA
ncbi:hypothetical protein KY310_01850, partial [Candidatus Woesearchaeota archaeon]|nr:hypothetical protein [Candidatus Woesearchaeota archaeon]